MGIRGMAVMLWMSGCGGFAPAYEGEPDCGRRDALHAVRDAACDESIQVACSCDDRTTLECVNGRWEFSHEICYAGLGVTL